MNQPSWWIEGAQRIVAEASKRKLIPKESNYDTTREGIALLRVAIRTKSGKPAAYLLEEDCRKLLEWKDGDTQ